MKVECVGSWRFQILLCIHAFLMSSEFKREEGMKFYHLKCSWILMEMSSKLFCPFKDFFILMEYNEVIIKKYCSLRMQECRLKFDTGCRNNQCFIFQIMKSGGRAWPGMTVIWTNPYIIQVSTLYKPVLLQFCRMSTYQKPMK